MADAAFGALVRARRQACLMTLVELAELSGVARGSLSNIEAGRRETTLGAAMALSDALGLGLAEHIAERLAAYD